MQSIDWFALTERLGLPLVALGVICVGLWRVARYLADRLLREDTGIITRVADRHITFLDSLELQTKSLTGLVEDQQQENGQQNVLLAEIAKELKLLLIEHQRPDSPFSTVRTNQAVRHLAQCLTILADELHVDIRAAITEIEHILSTP